MQQAIAEGELIKELRLPEGLSEFKQPKPNDCRIKALGEALRKNKSIESLDLRHSDIHLCPLLQLALVTKKAQEEAKLEKQREEEKQKMAEMLCNAVEGTGIRKLSLWPYFARKACLHELKKIKAQLTFLELTFCLITLEDIGMLGSLLDNDSSITTLSLPENFLNSQERLNSLGLVLRNSNLQTLNLSKNEISTPEQIAMLSHILVDTSITHLILGKNQMEPNCTDALINLLQENQQIIALDLSELQKPPKPEKAKDNCNYFSEEDLQSIQAQLTKNLRISPLRKLALTTVAQYQDRLRYKGEAVGYNVNGEIITIDGTLVLIKELEQELSCYRNLANIPLPPVTTWLERVASTKMESAAAAKGV